MSFQNLCATSGAHRAGGHASRHHQHQPRQGRDHEGAVEQNIRSNIQELQDALQKANNQLQFQQLRSCEGLTETIARCHDLAQKTEHLFRDWNIQMAGEPSEKRLKKFSYTKLQKAFEEVCVHLKDVDYRAASVSKRAALEGGAEDPSFDDDDRIEAGLLVGTANEQCQVQEEDVTFTARLLEERDAGIRRVQGQMAEVTQIFRDLAGIVKEQGQQFETIEQQAETAAMNTEQAGKELKKAANGQRPTRDRLLCMIALALLVLFAVVFPYAYHIGGRGQTVEPLRVGVDGGSAIVAASNGFLAVSKGRIH